MIKPAFHTSASMYFQIEQAYVVVIGKPKVLAMGEVIDLACDT